jgi:hypothetical protein
VETFNEAKRQAQETNAEFKAEKPRYAIKASAKTKYINVKEVVRNFTDLKIYQFNLITSLEGTHTVIDQGDK